MNPKIIRLEFCELEFYNNYMVCVIDAGVTITIEESNIIAIEGIKHFNENPFAYITYRKHSYSVDPSIYKYTSTVDNLVAFAVVSTNSIAIESAKLESIFLDKPFQIFNDLESAKEWTHIILEKYKNKKTSINK